MSDCFVLYLLLICMKKEKTGAGKFTNNNMSNIDFDEMIMPLKHILTILKETD